MVAAQFWKCIVGAVLILFPAGLRAEQKADQTKPYSVISILESSDEEVETLGNAGQISANRIVMAYVTANEPCELLIAVFTRNGRRLAHGWKPQWVSLEKWQKLTMTLGSYVSSADPQKRKAVEVWALFVAPQPAGVKEAAGMAGKIKSLKAAVQDVIQSNAKDAAKREDGLLRQLENFLEDDPQARRPKLEPLAKAGRIRGAPVPWRAGAAEANFSAERPGLIVIPSEPPEAVRPDS